MKLSLMSNVVSIHPYFQIQEGKLTAVKVLLNKLTALASEEEQCLWYDFSISESNVLFCREAYVGAQGLLDHVELVSGVIGSMLELTELIRCEVHGPAGELEKLKETLSGLNPEYFAFECGIGKPS